MHLSGGVGGGAGVCGWSTYTQAPRFIPSLVLSAPGEAAPTTDCIPIPSCLPTGLLPHPASCPPAACLAAVSVTGRTAATPRPRRRCLSTQVRGAELASPRPCLSPSPPPTALLTTLPLGPRLYKEPSAKSNKFIIHNALSHCCLAGKVNEPQKNRILEVSPRRGLGGPRGGRGGVGGPAHWRTAATTPPGN